MEFTTWAPRAIIAAPFAGSVGSEISDSSSVAVRELSAEYTKTAFLFRTVIE
ncbi:hypothetical protein D3C84_1295590 [compost metagenome]